MTGNPELGAWLRRQREERLWPRSEMARRIIKAAANHGDTTMPGADDVAHNVYRWERGVISPGERYRLYICDVFGIAPEQFGGNGEAASVMPPVRVTGARTIGILVTMDDGGAEVRVTSLPQEPAGRPETYRLPFHRLPFVGRR